ncbi:MAG: MotA/TolQ/ExbB proton channel family protein [Opitutales bacterium]|nr:MotA/TolQ/ExbB proton channel family protein [Opitutales bacterium]
MKKLFTIATVCGMALMANADTFEQAQVATKQELRDATTELAALREKITNEQLPMAKELDNLQSEVIKKRAEAAEMRGVADTSGASIINLQDQVKSLNDSINYMTNLLGDYTIRFETLTGLSERSSVTKVTAAATAAKENENLNAGQRLETQLAVIDAAITRLNSVIGGYSFDGKAIAPHSGEIIEGKYMLMGPITYFAPADTIYPAGITTESSNSIDPQLNTLKSANADTQIRELIANGSGNTIYGPAQAIMVDDYDQTLIEEWIVGGMVMPFILGLAFIAILIAIYKWIALAGIKSARQKDLDYILECLSTGNNDDALAYAKKIGGPVGSMLTAAVENANEDREVIEEVLYEKIISTQPKLERMLPFIAVVAATAPLLGLLGTVTGMIKTFKLITIVGTGDARSLSSGISEALITTKWGLVSAIPTLIIHAMLTRKARGVIGSMEQTAVGFMNGVAQIRESNNQSA